MHPQVEKYGARSGLVLIVALALAIATPALADTPVALRARIEASGPAVTLGEVFEGAGAMSGRAIAPAPAPGQVALLSTRMLAAAAQAAGLAWSAPAGVNEVRVTRAAGMRATLAPADTGAPRAGGETLVRRGDAVSLVYAAPGLQLATRARALEDGALGASVRLLNLQSNRAVLATVTGPGAASASAP